MDHERKASASSAVELGPQCPDCGEHSTIVRMSSTAILKCNNCGDSMLQPI